MNAPLLQTTLTLGEWKSRGWLESSSFEIISGVLRDVSYLGDQMRASMISFSGVQRFVFGTLHLRRLYLLYAISLIEYHARRSAKHEVGYQVKGLMDRLSSQIISIIHTLDKRFPEYQNTRKRSEYNIP